MRRLTAVFAVAALLLVAGAVAPTSVLAEKGGNREAAKTCQKGGYKEYTTAAPDRVPFKNAGQCTRYAAQGGELTPVLSPDISYDQAAGTIEGTGFTPNSTISFAGAVSPDGASYTFSLGFTDAMGAFFDDLVESDDIDFCFSDSTTGIEVTVTDGAGVSATESFPLSC